MQKALEEIISGSATVSIDVTCAQIKDCPKEAFKAIWLLDNNNIPLTIGNIRCEDSNILFDATAFAESAAALTFHCVKRKGLRRYNAIKASFFELALINHFSIIFGEATFAASKPLWEFEIWHAPKSHYFEVPIAEISWDDLVVIDIDVNSSADDVVFYFLYKNCGTIAVSLPGGLNIMTDSYRSANADRNSLIAHAMRYYTNPHIFSFAGRANIGMSGTFSPCRFYTGTKRGIDGYCIADELEDVVFYTSVNIYLDSTSGVHLDVILDIIANAARLNFLVSHTIAVICFVDPDVRAQIDAAFKARIIANREAGRTIR